MNAMKYLVLSILTLALPAFAQPFPSGSTGSDGDLTYSTPGTYIFDPKTHVPPLNPANDGVYDFTTINPKNGSWLQLRLSKGLDQ